MLLTQRLEKTRYIPIREALEVVAGVNAEQPLREAFGIGIWELLIDRPRNAARYTLLANTMAVVGAGAFLGLITFVALGGHGLKALMGTIGVVALIAPAIIRHTIHYEPGDMELLDTAMGVQADQIAELLRFRRDIVNGRIDAYERLAVDGPAGVWKKIDPSFFAADNGWVLIVGEREDRNLVRSRRALPQGQIWIDASTLPTHRKRNSRMLIEAVDSSLLQRVKAATLSRYSGATRRRLELQFLAIEAFRDPEIAALTSKQEQIRAVLDHKNIGISESGLKQIRYGIYTMLENRLQWPEIK